jgi:hypothetical protein
LCVEDSIDDEHPTPFLGNAARAHLLCQEDRYAPCVCAVFSLLFIVAICALRQYVPVRTIVLNGF